MRGWVGRASCGAAVVLAAGCGTTPQSTRPPPPPPTLAGGACVAALHAQAAAFDPISFRGSGDCTIDTPIRAKSLAIKLTKPAIMDCGLGERLWQFDREVVQPAAHRLLGLDVASLQHFGTYACRAETSGRGVLSQHAFGRAIDLAGFTLADGSRVAVETEWDDDGPKGEFLHEVARRACRYFSVVLTPESNADHHNHLHLDVGPDRLCGPA